MSTEQLATNIAAAEQSLAEAQITHAALTDKANSIVARITEARNRQAEITRARLEGECTASEANEYAALQGDLDALTGAHSEVTQALSASSQRVMQEQTNLERHQSAWEQYQSEQTYAAMEIRVLEIENLFCGAVTELVKQGREIGKQSVFSNWKIRPGSGLYALAHMQTLPTETILTR